MKDLGKFEDVDKAHTLGSVPGQQCLLGPAAVSPSRAVGKAARESALIAPCRVMMRNGGTSTTVAEGS